MAKIETEILVIKFSKIVKDSETTRIEIPKELMTTLEEVAQEMCEAGVIVEVEKAQ